MDIEKLESFAEDLFEKYNSEGTRTATNIVEVEKGKDFVVYQYDYRSLNGQVRRFNKKFLYGEDGKITHKGPVEVEK